MPENVSPNSSRATWPPRDIRTTNTVTKLVTATHNHARVPIQQALIDKGLPPQEHLVDAAYSSSELLVHSRDEQGITLRGPTRPSQGWQTQVEGAYTVEQFAV